MYRFVSQKSVQRCEICMTLGWVYAGSKEVVL